MKQNQLLSIIVLLILCCRINAQNNYPPSSNERKFKTTGGLTGWGNSMTKGTGYKVYYIMGDYSNSFKVPEKKSFITWYAQPQFNFVKADSTPKGKTDYEFGLNLGIRHYIKINEGFYFYQMLGSGPHYISAKVDRQASGYIFSDNLALGTLLRLNQTGLFLNLQYVQRHISNAGFKKPNGGINSYNFLIGLSHRN